MSVDNPEASFNPRIRKGCDISLPGPLSWQQNVSIHASVKDATCLVSSFTLARQVSIHASVKDATDMELQDLTFNKVSIHASVKDATRKEWYMIINGKFQSTHP